LFVLIIAYLDVLSNVVFGGNVKENLKLMHSTQESDSLLSRTAAYNKLKKLLDVKKKGVRLKKEFFNLFFREVDGLYEWKCTEVFATELFSTLKIAEKNRYYWEKKKAGKAPVRLSVALFNKISKKINKQDAA
jgi:hypothetical protein